MFFYQFFFIFYLAAMKCKTPWYGPFKRGLRFLSCHNPKKALMEFEKAVRCCPVNDPKNLGKILYYMGFALERLGQGPLAVKSWINARRLVKEKVYVKLIIRWVNSYGMKRQPTALADDYLAFRLIQVKKYMDYRRISHFVSLPEQDMVYTLIDDAWKLLNRSGILMPLTAEQKLVIFKRAQVDFPLLRPVLQCGFVPEPVAVDFSQGPAYAKKILPQSNCPCHSGLNYQVCCGRIQSPLETVFVSE